MLSSSSSTLDDISLQMMRLHTNVEVRSITNQQSDFTLMWPKMHQDNSECGWGGTLIYIYINIYLVKILATCDSFALNIATFVQRYPLITEHTFWFKIIITFMETFYPQQIKLVCLSYHTYPYCIEVSLSPWSESKDQIEVNTDLQSGILSWFLLISYMIGNVGNLSWQPESTMVEPAVNYSLKHFYLDSVI